jgi:hypothetical protein
MLIIGDRYSSSHKGLQDVLDGGTELSPPNGTLTNDNGSGAAKFTVEPCRTCGTHLQCRLQKTLSTIHDHNI